MGEIDDGSVCLFRITNNRRELITSDLTIQPRFKEEAGRWVLRLQFDDCQKKASPTSQTKSRLPAASEFSTDLEEIITDDKCWRREDSTGLSWVSEQFGSGEEGMMNAKVVVKWRNSQTRDKIWNQVQATLGKVNQHAGSGSPLRTIQAYKTSQLKGVWN